MPREIARSARNDVLAKRLPYWTGTFIMAALAVVLTGAHPLLQFDRHAVAAGQWWRVVTCHWTHWSGNHLFWDLSVFAVLGAIAERRCRVRFVACVLGSALLISAGVWVLRPDVELYRGLSGIDSALFVLVATAAAADARAARRPALAAVPVAALALFALKTAWEIATGAALFVDAAGGGFTPLPLTHAMGAAAGVTAALSKGAFELTRSEVH